MAQGTGGAGPDTELRKRAAWLLGMLALVAVLLLVLVGLLVRSSGGKGGPVAAGSSAPLDTDVSSPVASGSSAHHPRRGTSTSASGSATSGSASASGSPTGSASSGATRASCPGSSPCTLSGDVGDAAAAIDAYRTKHGRPSIPVRVSSSAQSCALSQGSTCTSHWAETQLASADGTMAVQKIEQFADLLNPQATAIEIGWAYDPGSRQYFFSTIREE